MGGIGKTELALQYAFQHLKQKTYPGGICWLRAREDLGSQIVAFANVHLDLKPPEDLELSQRVAWCWSRWPEQNTLIIIDDVQQYRDIQAILRPSSPDFRLLLTSRTRFGSPVQNYEIQVLSEDAALNLLRSLTAPERINTELETAKQICHWLGYLPLGLELVGRYLARKPDLSLVQLQQRLETGRLSAQAFELPVEMQGQDKPYENLLKAFELSWQSLSEPAQQLAALLSLFAPAEIPWSLVKACYGEEAEEELENWRDEELLSLSLLTRTGEGMYELHQLLREFFAVQREQMEIASKLKSNFCSAVAKVADQIPRNPTQSLIKRNKSLMPHFKEATTTLEPWLSEENLIKPATRLGQFFFSQADLAKTEYWYQQACQISKRLSKSHPDRATCLHNLAGFYCEIGKYKESENLFLRSMVIYKRQLGCEHVAVANVLNGLGLLYLSRNLYDKAEPLLAEALSIRKEKLEPNHIDIAISLNNLALLYTYRGQYSVAEDLFLRSLEIRERILESHNPDIANCLQNLASLYTKQGNYSKAKTFFIKALDIYERQLVPDHPNMACVLNNLAELYRLEGNFNEAETFYHKALQIRISIYGEDHPNTQTVRRNFILFLREVLQAGQTDQLSDHPLTQATLENLQQEQAE